MIEMLSDRSLGSEPATVSSGRYGLLELAPLAEILTAFGQLARENEATAVAARTVLDRFDPGDLHASVADSLAIARGYLGDWVPVVSAARGDGGRLDTAARYTLRLWVPGPATPEQLGAPGEIAGWLKKQLVHSALSPERRSFVQELLFSMETRHGALMPG